MKLKFKAIAAAAAMVVAGHASAALSDTFVSDGTLFLTVWDVSTNKSYVRDLGTSIDSFLPTGAQIAAGGANTVFNTIGANSLFTTHFASSSNANIRWTVVGVDQVEGDGNGSRFVSAFGTNPGTIVNGSVRGLAGLAVNFAGELIANSGVDFTGAANEYFSTGTSATDGGGAGWGPSIPGVGLGGSIISGFGAAGFYLGATSTDDGSNDPGNAAPIVRYANSGNFATLSLGSNGALTYNLAPVSAVPLPAAAWLMGAGLVAMGGAVRRRKAAKASA